jgi:iron complex outermembrane receptor protein
MSDRVSRPSPAPVAAALLLASLATAPPLTAQEAGSLSGQVTAISGAPAEGVRVSLVELRDSTTTDASGRYRFEDVPPGLYLLEASSPRFGRSISRVEVLAGGEASHDVRLDVDVHHEVVVVTAQADPRSDAELARPVAVLEADALQLQLEPTLGETLKSVPGVHSTYFGPGASRPVIRGLGGDRIRVLEDGIGSFDASSTSPDHAVSFDPISARRVEVVRGPATLLYGSSAVGGVVNTIDDRIPDSRSDRLVHGIADLAVGSVSDERSGAAALRVGRGPLAVRGEYSRRETGDLSIPGFAESEVLRAAEADEGLEAEEAFGVLANSALENESAGLGVALVGRRAFFGVAVRGFDTFYGVPGGHGHEEDEGAGGEDGDGGEEGPVRIDLEQRRLDVRGGRTQPFGIFRAAKLRFGLARYEHVELEGDEVGTTFLNDGWEGRLELLHRPLGALSGSVGLQVARRDFEAIGDEAFVPPSETRSWALFAFEELGSGPARGQLGVRYESQGVDAVGEAAASRSFDGLSGSVGLLWSLPRGFGAGLTLARSVKLPNAEELYSSGPHLATGAFEVGDPDLENETSLGLDLALRKRSGRLNGELTFFANWFDRYIYERVTGVVRDGLQELQVSQSDARFWGAELEAHLDLLEDEPHHLDLELTADLVRARLSELGEPLPRIPPARLGLGLHYQSQAWDARVEVRTALEQDRIAPTELPTDGYTFLNASVGYRLFVGQTVWDLTVRGSNLSDAEGRVHSSFLKDRVPLPGRNLRLSARVTF